VGVVEERVAPALIGCGARTELRRRERLGRCAKELMYAGEMVAAIRRKGAVAGADVCRRDRGALSSEARAQWSARAVEAL
jgi:hypothetical protein